MKKGDRKWRDIPGFEGWYQASKAGKIRSKKRTVYYCDSARKQVYPSVVLIPGVTESGYSIVTLCLYAKRYTRRVCRLIGLTFIPNPENKPQINHKDGDKRNDAANNLEWSSGSENQLHRYRVLKKGAPTGESRVGSKMSNKGVMKLRKMYSTGKFTQRELGLKFGVSQTTVHEVVYKKRWNHI